MKNELLSITEIANLRGVTAETLRFYDRIDLIKPTYVDPGSNYRYYSIRQYEKIGTIKELRQLNLSVKEIQEYFDDRNLQKSTEILDDLYKRLQKEIRQRMLLVKAIGKKLAFLRDVSVPFVCDTVFEQDMPERHIITLGEMAGDPKAHAFAFSHLEACLDECAPILASDRMGVYTDETILKESDSYIPAVPMIFVEKGEGPDQYKRTIPAGRYICMYYQGSGLEEYNPAFSHLLDYMRISNLEVNGAILQIYKIDVTVTSRPEELLMEIQIPVRPVVENKD